MKWVWSRLALAILILAGVAAADDTLELMDDAELEKLIQQEQYVIVLFSES